MIWTQLNARIRQDVRVEIERTAKIKGKMFRTFNHLANIVKSDLKKW
jgi:hypothetical protein